MALMSTLTEMSTRNIPYGIQASGGQS